MEPEARRRALGHAAALCDLARFEEASEQLGALLASSPEDPTALALMSRALLGRGELWPAREAALAAIAADPDAEWPERMASIACRGLSRPEEAIRHAERAVELAPLSAAPHLVLAQALCMIRLERGRALASAQRAAELAPLDPSVHITLGTVSAAAGDRTAAQAALQHALELDPDSSAARSELARLKLRGMRVAPAAVVNPGALAGAARGFADAVSVDPANAVARRNLDHVARVFVRALAWVVLADAFLARELSPSAPPLVRLIPLLPLLLVAITVVRYVRGLDAPLRAHLASMLRREGGLAAGTALVSLGAGALLAGCIAGGAAHDALETIGGLAAIVGFIVLALQTERHGPVRRSGTGRVLDTRALWLLAAVLLVFGAVGLNVVRVGGHATVGIVIAAICFVGAGWTLLNIQRRRSRS